MEYKSGNRERAARRRALQFFPCPLRYLEIITSVLRSLDSAAYLNHISSVTHLISMASQGQRLASQGVSIIWPLLTRKVNDIAARGP